MSFLLHLFHEVVVVDPTSSTEPPCTLSLPKRAALLSSSPNRLPLETDSMDCMHDIPAVWVAQPFTASPTVHRAPKAQQQRNPRPHDPSPDLHAGAQAVLPVFSHHFSPGNGMRNVDILLSEGPQDVHRAVKQ